MNYSTQEFDVLVLGAGLSGIGAACHLSRNCPDKRYAVLERRDAIGGTWDLFRYPGIRSDSDMCTFGYNFRPWNKPNVLADGPSIKSYMEDTAREYGVDRRIQFGRKVVSADWSSDECKWTLTAIDESSGDEYQYKAGFVIAGTGYYSYDKGYKPEFVNEKAFSGQIVHPQFWPQDLETKGKKIVVIGSGATAITLVPSLAAQGADVTMLQRSPTYIMTVPSVDPVTTKLTRFLPEKLAYSAARVRNIGLQRLLFKAARSKPEVVRRFLLMQARKQLGPGVDMKHFTPNYMPWDERLCVVPDGDLFKTLREKKAQIRTDHIEKFSKTGIQLKSGEHLEADIIVTATGLDLQILGGIAASVDGQPVSIGERLTYKGIMLEGVPNVAAILGYTNASWTLKADLASEYICRLLRFMDKRGFDRVQATDSEGCAAEGSVMGGLQSGYVQRAASRLPRQGSKAPWAVLHDYLRDLPALRFGGLQDDVLEFSARPRGQTCATTADATEVLTAKKASSSRNLRQAATAH